MTIIIIYVYQLFINYNYNIYNDTNIYLNVFIIESYEDCLGWIPWEHDGMIVMRLKHAIRQKSLEYFIEFDMSEHKAVRYG